MFKQTKKWFQITQKYFFLVVCFCLLLYLMHNAYYEIKQSVNFVSKVSFFKMSLWAFCLGLLIEWRGIINILKGDGHLHISVLIPLVFVVICFTPEIYWAQKFGLGRMFLLDILHITSIKTVMTTVSAVTLIRFLQR